MTDETPGPVETVFRALLRLVVLLVGASLTILLVFAVAKEILGPVDGWLAGALLFFVGVPFAVACWGFLLPFYNREKDRQTSRRSGRGGRMGR